MIILIFIFISFAIVSILISKYENLQIKYRETIFQTDTNKRIVVSFRNDDLNLKSDVRHESYVLSAFSKYGIKQTFGYIPRDEEFFNSHDECIDKNKSIISALTKWRKEGKIEISMHGDVHTKSQHATGEFCGLPYGVQHKKIQHGKEIFFNQLGFNPKIFIPPWNQADQNTLKACLNAGIKYYSGFWGPETLEGIEIVNSNAVLFQTGSGIIGGEELIKLSRHTSGTAFVNILYHSREDFDTQEKFDKLEKLLKSISCDPMIEISTISEIPEKYEKSFAAYRTANLSVGQCILAKYNAKLYSKAVRIIVSLFFKKEIKIDEYFNSSRNYYREGNYKKATIFANKAIFKCEKYIKLGRLSVFLFSMLLTLFLHLIFRLVNLLSYQPIKLTGIIIISISFLAALFINILRPISKRIITEINYLFILFTLGWAFPILLLYFVKLFNN